MPPSSKRAGERPEDTGREEMAREEEDEDEHAHEMGVVQEGLAMHDPAVGEGGGCREARHLDQPAGLSDAVALRAPAHIALSCMGRPALWAKCLEVQAADRDCQSKRWAMSRNSCQPCENHLHASVAREADTHRDGAGDHRVGLAERHLGG